MKKRKVKSASKGKTKEENGGVVDLNMVLHYVDERALLEGDEKEMEEEEVMEEEVGNIVDVKDKGEAHDEEEEDEEEEEQKLVGRDNFPVELGMGEDAGLVAVRDNIPDAEFEKMFKRKTVRNKFQVPEVSDNKDMYLSGPLALILVPTRELAMQIHSHISSVAKYTNIKVIVC